MVQIPRDVAGQADGPARRTFDWLSSKPKNLRGTMVLIRKAVKEGWLEGDEHADRRVALVEALGELLRGLEPGASTCSEAEVLAVVRCFTAMSLRDVDQAKLALADFEELQRQRRGAARGRGRPRKIRTPGLG